MFDSIQVIVGNGRQDTGAVHRALDVATQLFAAGLWDGRGRLVVHEAYETQRRVKFSEVEGFCNRVGVNVYAGVRALVEGVDFELRPLPAEVWEMHGLAVPDYYSEPTCRECGAALSSEDVEAGEGICFECDVWGKI